MRTVTSRTLFCSQLLFCVFGCEAVVHLTPSFTTIEVSDLQTGEKVVGADVSCIGVAVQYPGVRLPTEIHLKPTDANGQTVIPVGLLQPEQTSAIAFDVVVGLPSGKDTVHLSNRAGILGTGNSVVVAVLDTSTAFQEPNVPAVTGSDPLTLRVDSILSQIVMCSNLSGRIVWRMSSETVNGQYLSEFTTQSSIPGFLDTTFNGGVEVSSGVIEAQACPFESLDPQNLSGSTVGVLGPFNRGEYQRASISGS